MSGSAKADIEKTGKFKSNSTHEFFSEKSYLEKLETDPR